MSGNRVQKFYDKNVQYEWARLARHRMEFAVTMRALEEYLPGKELHIVDVGGGPGRYSIALAEVGHCVTLVDLSRNNLEYAEKMAEVHKTSLMETIHANALDLSILPEGMFDAALLMGPLYHLLKKEEREKAVRETLIRIRPGGVIFAAFICRYAALREMAKDNPYDLLEYKEVYDAILEKGEHTGDAFPNAYFAHPTEIAPLMESCGLETLNLIACEGAVSLMEEQVNKLKGELWEAWVDLNYRLSKDPSLHGGAEHLLYIGKKL